MILNRPFRARNRSLPFSFLTCAFRKVLSFTKLSIKDCKYSRSFRGRRKKSFRILSMSDLRVHLLQERQEIRRFQSPAFVVAQGVKNRIFFSSAADRNLRRNNLNHLSLDAQDDLRGFCLSAPRHRKRDLPLAGYILNPRIEYGLHIPYIITSLLSVKKHLYQRSNPIAGRAASDGLHRLSHHFAEIIGRRSFHNGCKELFN